MQQRRAAMARWALLTLAACALAGCGDQGPQLNQVSGTITFNGKPVPAGKIYFNPDSAKGNTGPQGFADIKDGQFDTAQGGRGTRGGALVIRVEGFEASDTPGWVGRPLFKAYELHDELPTTASTRNIDVPASAAAGLPTQVGPSP